MNRTTRASPGTQRALPAVREQAYIVAMNLFGKEASLVSWCFPALLLLSGCGETGPDCGAADVRNSVVKIVSGDSNNRLLNFAVENSDAVAELERNSASARTRGVTDPEAEKRAIREKAKQEAVYTLDEMIAVNSRNRSGAACSGVLYIKIGDTTVEKEVEFRVEQAAGGKISVLVKPFSF
jgi:hypothetical protein